MSEDRCQKTEYHLGVPCTERPMSETLHHSPYTLNPIPYTNYSSIQPFDCGFRISDRGLKKKQHGQPIQSTI